MNNKFEIFAGVITCAAAGFIIIQALYAQPKPKPAVYFVSEIDLKNEDAYLKEFVPLAQASVKNHGGKLLAAGPKVTAVDGAPPKRVAVNIWDSMESLQAWRDSADYREARDTGEKYATFRAYVFEGLSR
jgi:uncharacterized protein (DUF1330 family)